MKSEAKHVIENAPLLRVENLKAYFPIHGGVLSRLVGYVHAVDDVSLDVNKGETLGLVGESGCGKTTFARTVMRMVKATDGNVYFEGQDVLAMNENDLRATRKDMQLIFQDPFSSLDPRMPIGQIVEEPLLIQGVKDKHERKARSLETLKLVEIEPDYYDRYPHEFSGGQRQRISIARSLILKPKLILCDEPVSALDVSIQSQILNLLRKLQDELDLTYIFVSHALNVVRHVSDRVCVMYLGKVMELANADDIFNNPMHPYTQALLSAIPIPDPEVRRERVLLTGDIPSPQNPPSGCRFHTRCPKAIERCMEEVPSLVQVGKDHTVACHLCTSK